MNTLRRYWLAMLFVAASFCIAVIGYGRLPQRMAVHWNLSGQADGWMPKQAGAFVLPTIALILIVLLIAFAPQILRRQAVRGSQQNTTAKAYPVIVATIAAFLFYVTLGVIGSGVGLHLDVLAYAAVGLGVLLMVLGSCLGKTTPNPLLRVRLPWTLRSEEAWSRSNRVTGWLLVLAGVAIVIGALAGHAVAVTACAICAIVIVSTGYSWWVARRLENKRRH